MLEGAIKYEKTIREAYTDGINPKKFNTNFFCRNFNLITPLKYQIFSILLITLHNFKFG